MSRSIRQHEAVQRRARGEAQAGCPICEEVAELVIDHPAGLRNQTPENLVAVSTDCHGGDHDTCSNSMCACACHPKACESPR